MKLRPMREAPQENILILVELANGWSTLAYAVVAGDLSWCIPLTGTTVGPDTDGWVIVDEWGDPLPLGVLGWIPAPEVTR